MNWRQKWALPFRVVELLAVDDTVHEPSFSEEADDKLPIESALNTAGHDLVYEVVDHAVEKVVPRKLKE